MDARLVRSAMVTFVLSLATPLVGAGCMDRPVVAGEPTTKTNFTTKVSQTAVDKIDLLFSIDNSASMGDKQAYLEQAIPDLIKRLLTPNCLDPANPSAAPVSIDARQPRETRAARAERSSNSLPSTTSTSAS